MLKRCFVIFAQIAVKVRNFNFTFKSCFLNVFTLLFLCGGVVFSSPVFATVIYEKNLITQSSYRKTSKIYKLQFNNQDNYYEVSSVTGDCAFSSGVITSAQNNVDWNVTACEPYHPVPTPCLRQLCPEGIHCPKLPPQSLFRPTCDAMPLKSVTGTFSRYACFPPK